ncbi:MAG: ATP synthase F1 subunit epsilon [Fibrobacteria bacterium]|nr:ATP synthase F1 subunit epsilon [Fibrobacteria bacterium]
MIPVTLVDPEKVAWKGEAAQVVFAIGDGLVGILPGHTDAAFAIQPCTARITPTSGAELRYFLSGGIALMQGGILTIVADSAETPEQIDRIRAEEALRRARERLASASREIDYDRARLALARAIGRLHILN